jgi:hypothetical protein
LAGGAYVGPGAPYLVVDAGRLGENMEMVENMRQLLLALVFAALAPVPSFPPSGLAVIVQ